MRIKGDLKKKSWRKNKVIDSKNELRENQKDTDKWFLEQETWLKERNQSIEL